MRREGIRWLHKPTAAHALAALGLAERLVAASPDQPSGRLVLARALTNLGRQSEARACLETACGRFPGVEDLHAELALLLAHTGHDDAALARTEPWLPRLWAARLALKLHWRNGRLKKALESEAAVDAASPADPFLFECRAERLRAEPHAMIRLSDTALSHDPAASHAVYHKVVALAQLGRGEAAAELLGMDRFLSVAPVEGAAGGDEFLAALRSEIRANPTLHPDPLGHATRNGMRTRHFPDRSDRAAPGLMRAIMEAVSAYAETLTGEHFFVQAVPRRASLTAWALVFAEKGRQNLHVHPGCWVTGVFYVSAPPGSPRPGTIRIGGLPSWAQVDAPWPVVEVEPEPGTLILFPSFMPHETVPSGSATERISVAFDVTAA